MAAPAVSACRGGNLRERRVQVSAHLEWRRDGLWSQLRRGACRAARFSRYLLDTERKATYMRKNLMSALVLMVGFAASTMLSKAQDASGVPHLRKQGAATHVLD